MRGLGAQKTPDDIEAVGNCYEAAATALLFDPRFAKNWFMVHGHPTRTIEPYCQFGHAWLEKKRGNIVYDAARGLAVPKEMYYRVGKIDWRDNRIYTPKETRKFLLFFQHYGPWEGPDAPEVDDERAEEWLAAGKSLPKRRTKAKP